MARLVSLATGTLAMPYENRTAVFEREPQE